jgi:hypothetical protein
MLLYILEKENTEEKLYIFPSSLVMQRQGHLLRTPSASPTSNVAASTILLLAILEN